MYLEVAPRASPGKAMEGRVVDIEICVLRKVWGWKCAPWTLAVSGRISVASRRFGGLGPIFRLVFPLALLV